MGRGIERRASAWGVCGGMSPGLEVSLQRQLRELCEHIINHHPWFLIRSVYLRGADMRWIPTAWRNELVSCSRRVHSATR
jgi:hypothetical protein